MFPPPPALSPDEFQRRVDRLRAEGKPATFNNIDPEFAEWQGRVHIHAGLWMMVFICAIVLFALLITLLLRV